MAFFVAAFFAGVVFFTAAVLAAPFFAGVVFFTAAVLAATFFAGAFFGAAILGATALATGFLGGGGVEGPGGRTAETECSGGGSGSRNSVRSSSSRSYWRFSASTSLGQAS